MNVAYYSHYFVPEIGAPSARLHDLGREWVGRGHEVDVVTCFPNHPAGQLYPGYRGGRYLLERLDGMTVHRHWTYITPNRGFLRKTLGHVSFLPSALALSNPRIRRPDVVIGSSPTFFAAMAALAAARRHRVPFVMEVRDLWPAIFVDLGVLRNRTVIRALERLEMALYRRATRVVTVTEAFRRDLIARGVPAAKVATVRNGADVEFWQPGEASPELRRALGLDGAFVVLYLGAFGISQGLSRVLECARALRSDPRIRFLLVGDGAERERLVRQAAGLANVRLLEPVDKARARELYRLADVCLVPLRDVPLFETFVPSKLFEIMAMARPVVGSVRGEAAEILEESGAAVVVPPEDSAAMAGALRDLADRSEARRAMAERGREFVTKRFSREALARDYLDVLEDAVRETAGGRR
jgi:glycosyltransferase involved in cell wall biosynthesis